MRQSPPRLLVLGLLSGTKTAKEIWYMIYAISSIYSSFWCETSRNWEGQLFFHFNFFFSFHFSPCTTSFKKKRFTFPVGEAILVTLPLPPKTLQCIFRISVVLTGAGLWQSQGAVNLNGERLLHIVTYWRIHTQKKRSKIPPGTYILLVWKIRMPKDFPCWHMWTCGVWNRGLEMTETIPFFSSAIGQGSLHFLICQRPALSSEFSWGMAMDPKLLLKNFGKRWSMSCQHLVWTNLHLKNSRPKLEKRKVGAFSYSICPITCRF